jgi:hypothetical protein
MSKEILPGWNETSIGNDLVWGQLETPPDAPIDDTPSDQIMYAVTRLRRIGYTKKQMLGPMLEYFRGQGYNPTAEKIYSIYDKTIKLINAANNLQVYTYDTEADYKQALLDLDPAVTNTMADDWIANLKEKMSVDTFADLKVALTPSEV